MCWDRERLLADDQLRVEVVSSGQFAPTRWRSEARAKQAARRVGAPMAAGGLGAAIVNVTTSPGQVTASQALM